MPVETPVIRLLIIKGLLKLKQEKPIPFYEMFPFIKGSNRLASDYSGARVVSASINQPKTLMDITISVMTPVPPYELSIIEEMISSEYGIKTVTVTSTLARPASSHLGKEEGNPAKPESGSTVTKRDNVDRSGHGLVQGHGQGYRQGHGHGHGHAHGYDQSKVIPIMGRTTKAKHTPMSEVTLDLGRVTVRGEVCAVRSRFIEKSNSWLINFDITDYTGSINVNTFLRDEKASKIANAIKEGMSLIVTGTLGISKFDQELTLDPQNIFPYKKEARVDNAEEKRVELHLHTKMSAMDALTDIEAAIKRAVEWGHPAIAITDHGVVHSFPAAAIAAKKHKDKVKIIYGVEGYLRNGDMEKKEKKRRNNHIILLAKNKEGLHNLYKLITISHLEHYDGRPIIFRSLLEQYKEGLIIGSACESGEVFNAILNQYEETELHRIAELYDYLEIMPVCNNSFMLYGEVPRAKSEDDIRDFNRKIVELGRTLNKPVVATGDVHFLDPEHEVYRHILQTSKGFSGATDELPLYFKTTDEMLDEFSYLGEETAYDVVIKNPRIISDMCEVINPLPPPGQLFAPRLGNSAEELKKLVTDKTFEYYGETPPEIVLKRIDYELSDILRLNYDVIYMAAQKLVAYLREHKSRVGSRGSIGSSFVAYLAGITEVNPLPANYRCPSCKNTEFPMSFETSEKEDGSLAQTPSFACGADMPDKSCPSCGTEFIKDGFNIPFETFMGFDGEKIPDIDLNISSEHLNQAHKFTSDMFGSDYVFRAGTIGTVKDNNAYKFMKKYLETIGKTATRAEENRLAGGCVGVKQTTGQHPGGLIIIPQNMEITDFCPAQHPADDSDKGVITLHFEYKYIEDNLIKLDILGHDNPTMLRMLEGMTGVDADNIKLDDPETMSIFSSPITLGLPEDDDVIGKTGSIGIPEFGTPFTREMLNDTKPKDFDTLIRLSGYSHGTGVWLNNAKDLIESKKATVAETISSRDDIMLFLISKGLDERYAFKISESVRKGRKLPDGTEEEMRRHKIAPWYIDSCNTITYLFPKAHAVAYVMMAFRIAWFKVHKPLEFYSAHFYRRIRSFDVESMARGKHIVVAKMKEIRNIPNPTKKDEDLLTTLESCYEFYMRGFDFVGIDLYESAPDKFLLVGDKTLRPPLIAISGLGEAAAYELAEQREKTQFISIDDISASCRGVSKTTLDKLKNLGALRDLPDSSQMSLF